MDHPALADQIDVLLIDGGDPERAQREQAYLKSDVGHYGTPVPVVRAAVTRCARRFPARSSSGRRTPPQCSIVGRRMTNSGSAARRCGRC